MNAPTQLLNYASNFAPRDGPPANPHLRQGLVGTWHSCLGPTGSTLHDWSGRGNHGSLANMTPATDWVASPLGYALDFGSIGHPKHVAITIGDELIGHVSTLWVRARLDTPDNLGAVLWGTTTGGSVFNQITQHNPTKVYVHNSLLTLPVGTYLWDGLWHDFVFWSDPTHIAFYVDGELSQEAVAAGASYGAGDKSFQLGRWMGGGNWDLDGRIAATAIWDRALAPDEIQHLYRDPFALLRPRQTRRALLINRVAGPYRTAAGEMFHAGAAAAEPFVTGPATGQTFNTGQTAGATHG